MSDGAPVQDLGVVLVILGIPTLGILMIWDVIGNPSNALFLVVAIMFMAGSFMAHAEG